MAKKRKPAAKRGPRRGKNEKDTAETNNGGPSSSSSPLVANQEPSTANTDINTTPSNTASTPSISLESEDHIPKPVLVPKLHKNFGKFRCLFTDDEKCKKIELGSDSETNNSMDKLIDLCTGSESDSNAAFDSQSDSTSVVNILGSPLHITTDTKSTDTEEAYSPSIIENKFDTSQDRDQNIVENMIASNSSPENVPPVDNLNNPESALIEEQIDYDNNDDDTITVVQILEDDNPDLYYDLGIGSPAAPSPFAEENTELNRNMSNQIASQFQHEFQKLNLTAPDTSSKMECGDPIDRNNCVTPDLLFPKDLNESISHPDPSLTPNSTISDDSNSSRITLEQSQNNSNDSAESSPTSVRRSSRIKTISNLKQKTKGYGLVKTPLKKALLSQTKLKLEELCTESLDKFTESSNSNTNSPTFPVPVDMPVKVKSRWRRSSELEMVNSPVQSPTPSPGLPKLQSIAEMPNEVPEVQISKEDYDRIIKERMDQFVHLDENEYLCERMISRDTKKMICDCFMTKEELDRGEYGCGEDCLNRLLMIECNYRCPVGERCTNRRFQKRENSQLQVFYADKKGCGVEAAIEIQPGEFLMEYVGEVLDYDQFYQRAQSYSDENNLHHYFMSLKGDTVIDATMKGNISRFINHSCDPNAETQKWTVNGELRIGFFSKRDIKVGEEITFDYQFQRFGKVAQRCYCGADNCRGWIGGEPDSDEDDYEDEDDVFPTKSGEKVLASPGVEGTVQPPRRRRHKRERRSKTKDLDADISEEIESLSLTGIKNQSHTLVLSRLMVRVKSATGQTSLLRLLRDADVPCRRLFLDYRGLRLLAPWCNDAPLDFRLEMLQTVDRLPIPNKTMVQESRFFTIVERWLNSVDVAPPLLIDENTGLPAELPNQTAQDIEKIKESTAALQKVKDLSKQLIERWSSLKEVFKIPKKERLQQMKEHERQANVERRAADSSGSRNDRRDRDRDRDRDRERDRDRDKYRDRDRDRDRDRERDRERERDRDKDDRDRRKRRSSPDGRRSIRLSDRVLASVPPMSKEERRRAFAEAALRADSQRRQDSLHPHTAWYWRNNELYQMYPQGMMPPGLPPGMQSVMSPGLPPGLPPLPPGMSPLPTGMPHLPPGMMPGEMPPEWGNPDLQPPGFFPGQPFCMTQPNFMNMGGFPGGFMFPQQQFPPDMQMQPPTDNSMEHQQHQQHQQQQVAPPVDPRNVVLPAMWRSAVDDRGRTYYYHVKIRHPQWAPPPPPQIPDESSSEEEEEVSRDTSVIKKQMMGKMVEGVNGIYEVIKGDQHNGLIPEDALTVKPKKRRPGLVTERPISPRTEEDKLAGRLEVKRYRETKEKLRKRREKLLRKVKMLHTTSKRSRKDKEITPQELQMLDLDSDSETESDSPEQLEPEPEPEVAVEGPPEVPEVETEEMTRKIKEAFRSSMARVMVHHLNPYRHRTALFGRITCTADFKHLARKLTHFVMLKELKHCRSVDELVVTESVKSKAKEFVKKYMAKFGPVYRRPVDEAD